MQNIIDTPSMHFQYRAVFEDVGAPVGHLLTRCQLNACRAIAEKLAENRKFMEVKQLPGNMHLIEVKHDFVVLTLEEYQKLQIDKFNAGMKAGRGLFRDTTSCPVDDQPWS